MSHADTLRAQIAYFDSWGVSGKLTYDLLAALRSELAECEEVGEKWSVGAATDPKDGALILKVAPPPAPKPASPDKATTEARCYICGRPATLRDGQDAICEDRWNGVTCALDSAIKRAAPAPGVEGDEAFAAKVRAWYESSPLFADACAKSRAS